MNNIEKKVLDQCCELLKYMDFYTVYHAVSEELDRCKVDSVIKQNALRVLEESSIPLKNSKKEIQSWIQALKNDSE